MRIEKPLSRICAALLALGVLPSLIALTNRAPEGLRSFLALSGPVSPLKVFAPFLIALIWLRRRRISRPIWNVLALSGVVLTIFTAIAAVKCGASAMIIREWAVMVLSFISAVCLLVLSPKQAVAVLTAQLGAVVLSVVLEFASPAALNWFFHNLFDPARSALNQPWSFTELANGFWDNGSLGRIAAYTGWLFAYFLVRANAASGKRPAWKLATTGLLLASFAVLASTQRAPLVGLMAGALVLCAHLYRVNKSWKPIAIATSAAVLLAIMTVAFLPKDLIVGRMKSIVTSWTVNPNDLPIGSNERSAILNSLARVQIHKLSFHVIAHSPLGNACIPEAEYRRFGLDYRYHSHSLFLQQFRDKGWLWGGIHVLLWLASLFGSWKSRRPEASLLCAGISCTIVMGLFDQPWFVLNQGLFLATYIVAGLTQLFPAGESRSPSPLA